MPSKTTNRYRLERQNAEMLDARLYDEDADAANLISDPFDDDTEAQIDSANFTIRFPYNRCVQRASR